LRACVEVYRRIRDDSGVQVVRRSAAEEAVSDFLD
jgi:hypothetical protein